MAKSKSSLIAEGKKIGLNLTDKMSVYELEHRIADKKAELKKKEEEAKKKDTPAAPAKRIRGEH
jgi:uncharacterized small protein (DUF1192 family)